MSDDVLESPAPPGTGLHRVGGWLWQALVVLVVLLAVYVSAGRYAMTQVGGLREWLLGELNERLPFQVDVAQLTGSWSAFSPEMAFDELLITQPDGEGAPVRLTRGSLRVDLAASLASRSLQLSSLEFEGLSLRARLTDEGIFAVDGFEGGDNAALLTWLNEFLPRVERLALLDNALTLSGIGAERDLHADLTLSRAGNERLLQGRIEGEGLRLAVRADGVGNPLRPLSWRGDVFVDVATGELADFSVLWSALDWPFNLTGSAAAQFWLNRSDGDSHAQLRMNGTSMGVEERGGAWSLPLDKLAFEAALTQRRNHWALIAEDFHAERDAQSLDLSRVQFEWWGSALRLRASELGLDGLPTLLAAAPGVPKGLREALPVLAPSGRVESLELRLDDLSEPGQSWSLRGLLDRVSAESWRGAPGLSGVSGYFELEPGGGIVQLDAGPFVMAFPKVYEAPLRYAEAWGDIALSWHGEGLRIDSDLIRARGEEGEVRALFAVDIPFRERVTGPEMELLAGLQNSTAIHRDKYIPRVLPRPLTDWLRDSIGAGTVRSAGFLWRGSLRPKNTPHRSIQLALDVADARLRFDPAWPALHDVSARVRMDDGRTWAQADTARILDSAVDDLHVRVLPRPGEALLTVRGNVQGDASDGQRLLVDSPLAAMTGGAFADWTLSGPIGGELALELLIGQPGAGPEIDLALELDGVDARMTALGLPVEDIGGTLRYRSERGFAGSALDGRLWSRPLSAAVADRAEEPGAGEDPEAAGAISVALSGTVDTAALGPWLSQPVLGFMDGPAAVSGELRLARGAPPRLSLGSSLEGVSIDAPRPFGKAAASPLPMSLELTLRDTPTLALALGERLDLRMDFSAGKLDQLLARIGAPERAMDCDATFCAHGEVSELDLAAWRSFADRYLAAPAEALASADAPYVPSASAGVQTDAGQPVSGPDIPSYRIDSLAVGRLSAGERQLGQARVDLWGRGALWQGSVESPWLQGALSRDAAAAEPHLLVEYLDLARLEGGEPLRLDAVRALLPSLRVDVLELRSGERQLGALGFYVDAGQPGDTLYFRAIEGDLWGVDLAAEEPGMLAWREGADGEQSALELDIAFGDIGNTLVDMGYARSLESRRGSAAVRLRWPGAPNAFEAARAEGRFAVSLRDGRVMETRSGALAMVSFLNFAEILRRASLSHMFESGIPFESASADLSFASGVMDIRDMTIDGAASAFAFDGRRDLTSGEIEGELVVTLPVANNLPWVAALAGGPAVAAGVFVVSKVFEKQVNRMSSAVYSVRGGIDDPQVSFRRLFDDRPAEGAAPAAPVAEEAAPGAPDDTDATATPAPAPTEAVPGEVGLSPPEAS